MLCSSTHRFHRGVSLAAAMALVAGLTACGDSTETPKQPSAPAAPAVPPPPPSPIITEPAAPIANTSAVVSSDGKTMSVIFRDFQLRARAGDTKAAVFNAAWPVKLAPEDVVVVSLANLRVNLAATSKMPTVTPGQPVPAPRAGDALAVVQVSVGSASQTLTWSGEDSGNGDRLITLATPFGGGPDYRNGSRIPLNITARLSGMTSQDALLSIDSLDVRLFVERKPVPQPPAPAPVAQPGAAPGASQPSPAGPPGPAPAPAPSQPANL